MKYIYIAENDIIGKGEAKLLNKEFINIEVNDDVYNNIDKFIYSNGKIITNPEYPTIELNNKKDEKITKNDKLRDKKLLEGIEYNNVLFDSDTDQKTNLLATYQMLSDEDTITWYGKDNKALLCTKQDLLTIGKLIIQLHSYCWNRNAEIKKQIDGATTLEELESVDINYETMDNR